LEIGGLRQLPRVYPAEELLNKAINQAMYVKEDVTVQPNLPCFHDGMRG
jgi:hypothetical protein